MVMQAAPLAAAMHHSQQQLPEGSKRIYLSPQGQPLTQAVIQALTTLPGLMLLCGRYEGVDQRLIDNNIDTEYSMGDYVISGGEFAALTLIDALTRLLPGALGHDHSAQQDSFSHGLLDYPHYTRPETWDGKNVPKVLLSGDHKAIARWRLKQAIGQTWRKRPDLLAEYALTHEESALLTEFQQEFTQK